MSKKITIAIDGFSSCGKSTLAKQIAHALNYIFIDSGAMYRAVTYFFIHEQQMHPPLDHDKINDALKDIHIHFEMNPTTQSPEIYLNNKNINREIRLPYISENVSKFATIKSIRTKLVELQQKMGEKGGIVMDGRDIGTVVFPNAELKLFITASIEIRTDRRLKELRDKNIDISFEEVQKNLMERDQIDSTRKESPLKQAKDAILIDNTHMSKKEQLDVVLEIINRHLKISC